jgi:ABC-type sugar transport system ATPase subunit
MNFLDVTAGAGVVCDGQALPGVALLPGTVKLGIRPEHLVIRPEGGGDLPATVTLRETLGGDAYLYVRTPSGQALVVRAEGDTALNHGDRIGLALPPSRVHLFGVDGRRLVAGGAA